MTIICPSWLLPTVWMKAGDPFLLATSQSATAGTNMHGDQVKILSLTGLPVKGLTKKDAAVSTGRDWSRTQALGG